MLAADDQQQGGGGGSGGGGGGTSAAAIEAAIEALGTAQYTEHQEGDYEVRARALGRALAAA